ncbi:hypothetical protein [Nitrosospira multiformis]|nr:hypothetical protein [Nitrosospira multiformis]
MAAIAEQVPADNDAERNLSVVAAWLPLPAVLPAPATRITRS